MRDPWPRAVGIPLVVLFVAEAGGVGNFASPLDNPMLRSPSLMTIMTIMTIMICCTERSSRGRTLLDRGRG